MGWEQVAQIVYFFLSLQMPFLSHGARMAGRRGIISAATANSKLSLGYFPGFLG